MSYVHNAQFRIRYYECGASGEIRYSDYLRYMQEAAIAGSAAVGYSEKRYTEEGYLWLAYGTNIEYFQPLAKNDEFTVRTWVHDFRRVRSLPIRPTPARWRRGLPAPAAAEPVRG